MSADILIGTDLTALEQAIRNELAKFFDFKNVSLKIFVPYENDIAFNENGDIMLVDDVINKVSQKILKLLYTPLGGLLGDSNYGTNLREYIGEKWDAHTANKFVSSLRDALEKYNSLVADTPQEALSFIDEISVYEGVDPRSIVINLKVSLTDGRTIVNSIFLTV